MINILFQIIVGFALIELSIFLFSRNSLLAIISTIITVLYIIIFGILDFDVVFFENADSFRSHFQINLCGLNNDAIKVIWVYLLPLFSCRFANRVLFKINVERYQPLPLIWMIPLVNWVAFIIMAHEIISVKSGNTISITNFRFVRWFKGTYWN